MGNGRKPDYGELVTLPNGTQCFYRESDHSYHRHNSDGSRGKRLTGVSTVCGPFDFRPDNLMNWAARLELEGVVTAYGDSMLPASAEKLHDELCAHGLDWRSIREQAATRGVQVHKDMLHALALGESIPDLAVLPDDQRGYGQAVLKWWRDKRPKVLQAEQLVLSEEHGFAGTFDLRCEIQGVTHLLDLKTSNYISTKFHAQIAGYDLGAEESGIGPSTSLVILQVGEDGEYHEIPGRATHDDFLAGLDVYRRAGRLNRKPKAPT